MATVNFSVPEDVRDALNKAFANRNKSAVIADLMRRAVEHQAQVKVRGEDLRRISARRGKKKAVDAPTLRRVRENGRP